MKLLQHLVLFTVLAVSLSACNTVRGMRLDMKEVENYARYSAPPGYHLEEPRY